MTKQQAINAASNEAVKYGVKLAIVNAPIEMAEESEPFGYAPAGEPVKIVFRFATIVGYCLPNGKYEEIDEIPVMPSK